MKTKLNMLHRTLSRWLSRVGASLRRVARRSKPEHAPQSFRGGQVI